MPYDIRIDKAALPALVDYCGDPDLPGQLERHLPFYPMETERQWTHPDRYVDAFGCVWRVGSIPHIEGHLLKTPSLDGYTFPDLSHDGWFGCAEAFLAAHSDHLTFCGDAHGLYDRCWALRGMEDSCRPGAQRKSTSGS